jgi:hypothetical protein
LRSDYQRDSSSLKGGNLQTSDEGISQQRTNMDKTATETKVKQYEQHQPITSVELPNAIS